MIAGLDGLGQWVLLAARAYRSADIFAGVILLGAVGVAGNACCPQSRRARCGGARVDRASALRDLDDHFAERPLVEMIERRRQFRERITAVDHRLKVRTLDRRDKILQRPAVANADAMKGQCL